MSAEPSGTTPSRPLVVLVCEVELLGEALRGALGDIADVRMLPAGLGDTEGLLRSIRPDAIVVDDEAEAEAATSFARQTGVPLVHVAMRDGQLRLFVGEWVDETDGGISPESVRNLLVGRLLGRASQV